MRFSNEQRALRCSTLQRRKTTQARRASPPLPPPCFAFGCAGREGGEKKTHVIAPGLSAPGLATCSRRLFPRHRRAKSLSDLRPKGRTERRALWLPAASMHMTNLPCTSKTNVTSVHSRLHACAPHAVGLCGLLHVPGSAAYAHSPRSFELSPGHALGPSSVSPASHPRRRLGHTQSRKRQGHDVVRTNRIPHHVSKTIATHPLPARDEVDDTSPRR
jgi:hypothetical protein